MNALWYSILASLVVSAGSLVGIATLYLKEDKISAVLIHLVSLSTGVLLGGAFFHLLPESLETLPSTTAFGVALCAFLTFLVIEKVFHWRHCHKNNCDVHAFGYVNLIGDAVHNFIDGIIIAGTFVSGTSLGITTSVMIALHEIPQEIGDFGVLLYAGFNKKKAIVLNFLTALTVVLGCIVGFFLSKNMSWFIVYLPPFAAGGFLYIASSDLIPEIKKTKSMKTSIVSFCIMMIGIFLTLAIKKP